jgi:hypothetical protein
VTFKRVRGALIKCTNGTARIAEQGVLAPSGKSKPLLLPISKILKKRMVSSFWCHWFSWPPHSGMLGNNIIRTIRFVKRTTINVFLTIISVKQTNIQVTSLYTIQTNTGPFNFSLQKTLETNEVFPLINSRYFWSCLPSLRAWHAHKQNDLSPSEPMNYHSINTRQSRALTSQKKVQ